jgi:tRNA G10  N-methylase Trm11
MRPLSVDAIVTEPFMGSTSLAVSGVSAEKVKNTLRGLEKLYIGCLREWRTILRDNGVVVMALPSVLLDRREYFVKNVIDSCARLGYTIEAGPIAYYRPQAVVRRNFYTFRKQRIQGSPV